MLKCFIRINQLLEQLCRQGAVEVSFRYTYFHANHVLFMVFFGGQRGLRSDDEYPAG